MAYGTLAAIADATKALAVDLISGSIFSRTKIAFGAEGAATDVSSTNRLPVSDPDVEASLEALLAKLSADPATQTTTAAILAKLSGDPASQTTLAAVASTLQSIFNRTTADPATQTTLAAILTRLNATLSVTSAGQATVVLGTSISVAAGAGSPPVTAIPTGSYLWDALFTGTSLKLQELGPDGSTWIDIGTQTAAGRLGVVIGNNASVRLFNPNGAAVTAVTSRLA